MKYLYLIVNQLLFLVNAGVKDYKLFPNLPTGEFIVDFKAILPCSTNPNSNYQLNLYLSKTSSTTTELRGNITAIIPFNDTNVFHMNMAVKDSIGGWKDNAFVYTSKRACSTMKFFTGDEQWKHFLKIFGYPRNTTCPTPKGVFVSKGFDLTNVAKNSNFPKTFFYGTYKLRLLYTDGLGNQNGCIVFVVEIKRPWETT